MFIKLEKAAYSTVQPILSGSMAVKSNREPVKAALVVSHL